MLLVGLTGGIASGKSTVLRVFKRLGAGVIDADRLARDMVLPGKDAWREIRQRFGSKVFYKNHRLNRAALGKIVFGDEKARKELNGILHPKILAEEKRLIEQFRKRRPKSVLVVDAALMIESGSHKWKDTVLLVTAPDDERLKRLMKKGMSRKEAAARIDSQMPQKRKERYADIILRNDGSLYELRREAARLYKEFAAKAKV